MLDLSFTMTWVRERNPEDPESEFVDKGVVEEDRKKLERALRTVTRVANLAIAHNQRIPPPDLTFEDIDAAFGAVEEALLRYHLLLLGRTLLQAEPAPQFDTHEVFTFPWIESAQEVE